MATRRTTQTPLRRTTQTPTTRGPDLASYFGPRNRHRFNPQINTNYTLEALEKAPTRKEADEITTIITSLFDQPFSVSLAPGGLGSLVFSLAESPRIAKIFVSEPNNNLRQLLNNNLRGYALTNKVVVSTDYQREESSVLVLDLIEDPTLDIANTIKAGKFPVYAFRVVSDYTPIRHQGYECSLEQTGNPKTNLLICSALGEEQVEEHVEEGGALDVDEAWLENLITFLDGVLTRIIPSKEDREAYFREDLLAFWIQAFTHQTIDPNFNYEVMEMLGDRSMKFGFADYLIQRIAKITESQLTELQNYYLTTIPQSNLARSLGFASHIRIVGEVKAKVLEDVLEAFFGSLFRVSEEVAGGRGYYNVFSMIVSLYKEEPLEKQLQVVKAGRDKTVFEQSLAKLRLNPKTELIRDFYDENGMTHFTLTLSTRAREFFESYGMIIPKVIAHGIGNSKRAAENNAYSEALSILREKGMTPEWIEQQRSIFAFDRPEYQPYLPTARARLEREGFTKMTFSTPVSTTTTRQCVVQLIGHRPNGTQQILATIEACDQRSGRTEVLRLYATGK